MTEIDDKIEEINSSLNSLFNMMSTIVKLVADQGAEVHKQNEWARVTITKQLDVIKELEKKNAD